MVDVIDVPHADGRQPKTRRVVLSRLEIKRISTQSEYRSDNDRLDRESRKHAAGWCRLRCLSTCFARSQFLSSPR